MGPMRSLLSVLGALAATACSSKAIPRPSELALAAGPGSSTPRLTETAEGEVLVSWTEPQAQGAHALRWSVLGPQGLSAPATAASGADWLINWADFPSVTRLSARSMLAHYLVRRGGKRGAGYDIAFTRSDDGGATWSPPWHPHDDATETEHGFVSVVPRGQGRALALWLDGRAFAGHAEAEAEAHAAMQLRASELGPEAAATASLVVDDRTCSCCQTSAVALGEEVLAVYRDRTQDELRDIALARYAGGKWSAPSLVHADGWHIEGCPVNGPTITARDAAVAVAWYTEAKDQPQVLVALSRDGGTSFAAPVRVDLGHPQGRVDVALLGEHAFVSWQELSGNVVALRLRAIALASGVLGTAHLVDEVAAGRASGFPQLAVHGADLVMAWTSADASGDTKVRLAKVAAAQLTGAR